MSEKQELWDQQSDEPLLWFQRFDKFRLMKPLHSIPKVYQKDPHTKKDEKTRTKAPGEWYEQARVWKWEERAAAWDAYCDKQIEAQILAEEKEVTRKEYALRHKRITELNRILKKLLGYLKQEDYVWLPDVKGIGNGPGAERVDLIRFNEALFTQIRGILDDIAKEKGERVKKTETAITEFPPNVYIGFNPEQEEGSEL